MEVKVMALQHRREGRAWRIEWAVEGQAVSGLWIWDLEVRLGSAPVKLGGIGGVETKAAFRGQGHARRVMEGAVDFMAMQGYDVSVLFGIQDFYEKFGFVSALPDYHLRVPENRAASAEQRLRAREFEPEDAAAVLAIYAANNARRTGAVVRSVETWAGFNKAGGFGVPAEVLVFLDDGEEIVGYMVYDRADDRCCLAEIGFREAGGTFPFHRTCDQPLARLVFESALSILAARARLLGQETLSLLLPPDHPFAVFSRRYGCEVQVRYPRSGGGMARIIHLRGVLAKMQDELAARLRDSAWASWQGHLALKTDLGTATLRLDAGSVALAEDHPSPDVTFAIPQAKLTPVLLGSRPVQDVLLEPDVSAPEAMAPLLETLFPPGFPYLWWPDRF